MVTGTKTEEKLIDAPPTMSVITSADDRDRAVGELRRAAAHDPRRQHHAGLGSRHQRHEPRGDRHAGDRQLALLDGRSLYQDFFGFVMWDFLPVNLNEVKQIEVIRGPASAVWGANALYGVVNVISKTPREMQGTSAHVRLRRLRPAGRRRRDRSGTSAARTPMRRTTAGRTSCRAAATRRMRWRGRPGQIPATTRRGLHRANTAVYPPFTNTGTTQPKFDARVDYDYEDGRKLSFSGGVAGTDGIMHSGIGPFDINSGSVMSYAKANFTKGALRAGFFTNILNGDADQLLTRGLNGAPITFTFDTTTFDFDLSNVQTFAKRHVVSYGGNLRFNTIDLSIAPDADNRTEFGIYGQDEIFLSDHFRLVAGGRVDRFDFVDDFVFSPRVAFLIKPRREPDVPRLVQQGLSLAVGDQQLHRLDHLAADRSEPPQPCASRAQYLLPVAVVGNTELEVQSLDAFEIGYSGVVANGRAIISAAYYMNWLKNDILFTQDGDVYTRGQPAAELAAAAGRDRACSPQRVIFLPSHVHLPELRQEHEPGHRARRQRLRQQVRQRLRQLLVSERPGSEGLSALRAEPAAEQPLQRRRQLHLRQVPGQPLGHLHRRGVLAGRARRSVPRHDRAVHAGERRRRLPVAGRQGHDVAQGRQPGQLIGPAARLRRHHEVPDGGGVQGLLSGKVVQAQGSGLKGSGKSLLISIGGKLLLEPRSLNP